MDKTVVASVPEEKPVKSCPLRVKNQSNFSGSKCIEHRCNWYIDDCCAIETIARIVTETKQVVMKLSESR